MVCKRLQKIFKKFLKNSKKENRLKKVNNKNQAKTGHIVRDSSHEWSFEVWKKQALFLCKRGNLETELLLKNYINSIKISLPIDNNNKNIKQKTQLIDQLFLESEQNLFHWLLNSQPSSTNPVLDVPEHYLQLITEIRDNYLK